ncbi:flagellar basal body rod protein FlgB [Azospirillum thermophilum]|uniref:Flagellar basal body rod protein FlgB n=1 Tax=Azospirillum thermophilum TaxID=2202148 RepID=A0A2S2CUZ7_9PROT|nr:flagellar biosynthesis protein FlgG [Azospirillum thermophilum]AWK88235.1 flagellar biosynthesis protein FlgG [Azospirillum thermophilum]
MDFSNISVFRLAGARLDYLAERQRLIAENVVNANTPDYQAKDLKPFESLMNGQRPVTPSRTSSMHLAGLRPAGSAQEARRPDQWEVTPDGNSVSLEQEMNKGSETRDAFSLTAGVFQRNVQMLRAAWRVG